MEHNTVKAPLDVAAAAAETVTITVSPLRSLNAASPEPNPSSESNQIDDRWPLQDISNLFDLSFEDGALLIAADAAFDVETVAAPRHLSTPRRRADVENSPVRRYSAGGTASPSPTAPRISGGSGNLRRGFR